MPKMLRQAFATTVSIESGAHFLAVGGEPV
jgi:hypothetical protein